MSNRSIGVKEIVFLVDDIPPRNRLSGSFDPNFTSIAGNRIRWKRPVMGPSGANGEVIVGRMAWRHVSHLTLLYGS